MTYKDKTFLQYKLNVNLLLVKCFFMVNMVWFMSGFKLGKPVICSKKHLKGWQNFRYLLEC